jgi:tryptophanase
MREEGYRNKSIKEIAESFSRMRMVALSAVKRRPDEHWRILCTNIEELYEKFKSLAIAIEGFITYGGLACMELEAMAIGCTKR